MAVNRIEMKETTVGKMQKHYYKTQKNVVREKNWRKLE